MTPEEAAQKFCFEHSNPNWARHHAPALAALILECCRAALRERDAQTLEKVMRVLGDVYGEYMSRAAKERIRALLEEAGSNG